MPANNHVPPASAASAQPPEHPASSDPLPPVVLGPIEVIVDDPADETPRPLPQPYRRRITPMHHELSTRELMLGWCFWLLGSWIVLGMGIHGTPVGNPVRWMIFASLIGMMILWPAFRLSQDGCARRGSTPDGNDDGDKIVSAPPLAAPVYLPSAPLTHHIARVSRLTPGLIFRDWVALNSVFQAVVWPHLLTAQWHLEQAAWVSVAVAAWSLLGGALVAWGCRSCQGAARLTAMVLVLLLFVGEPLVLAWFNRIGEGTHQAGFDWAMHVSPIEAIYALTTRPIYFDAGPWVVTVLCVFLAAAAGWAWLWLVRPSDSR